MPEPIRIVVETADNAGYTHRSGTTKEGKEFSIRRQTVYMHVGKIHPVPVDLSLGRDVQPYEPGDYTIAAESFKPNGRGGIEIDSFNLKLVPYGKKGV